MGSIMTHKIVHNEVSVDGHWGVLALQLNSNWSVFILQWRVWLRVTSKLSQSATDSVDAGRLMKIPRQPRDYRVIYTVDRLDVWTREEQRICGWSQDDMTNTGINMFLEAIDNHVPTSSRRVMHIQLYRMQVWEQRKTPP